MKSLAIPILLLISFSLHAQTPEKRNSAMMVYNPDLGEVVMFGGSTHSRSSVKFRDSTVWSWNGVRWKRLTDTPSLRANSVMGYDTDRKVLVIAGGGFSYSREKSTSFNDTWEFDGKTWKKTMDSSPVKDVFHHASGYDPVEKGVFVFGGFDPTQNKLLQSTLVYQNNSWKELPMRNSPPARNLHTMFFDKKLKGMVVLAGDPMQPEGFHDMWILEGTNWTRLADKLPFALTNTYGAAPFGDQGNYLCISGSYHEGKFETWVWSATKKSWRKVENSAPTPRNLASICYDEKRKCIVMFGGEMGIESVNEVWEFGVSDEKWKKVF